jgi:hypothetical protein
LAPAPLTARSYGGSAYTLVPARAATLASDPVAVSHKVVRAAAQRHARILALEMGHRPLLEEITREWPRIASGRSGDEPTGAEQRIADQIAAGATS